MTTRIYTNILTLVGVEIVSMATIIVLGLILYMIGRIGSDG